MRQVTINQIIGFPFKIFPTVLVLKMENGKVGNVQKGIENLRSATYNVTTGCNTGLKNNVYFTRGWGKNWKIMERMEIRKGGE